MPNTDQTDIHKSIISRLEDIGIIKEKINAMFDLEIFEHLSKHDMYWNEQDLSKQNQINWDLRGYFLNIQTFIDEIQNVLERE